MVALMAIIFQNDSFEIIIQFTVSFQKMLANLYIKKLQKDEETFDLNKKVNSYVMPYYRMFAGVLSAIFQIDGNEVNKILQNFTNDDFEIMAFMDLFGENMFFFDVDSREESTKIDSSVAKLEKNMLQNPCVKFSMEKIEKNYALMHKNNFFNMCQKCL